MYRLFAHALTLSTLGLKVCRDPRWGRCYESFSEDTSVVRMMTDVIYGLQGNGTPGIPFVSDRFVRGVCSSRTTQLLELWRE